MINYLSVQINFYSKEQCALPAKVRRELEFRFFGEGQNIFDLRGRGGGGGGVLWEGVIFRKGKSPHSPSIFSFWNARFLQNSGDEVDFYLAFKKMAEKVK